MDLEFLKDWPYPVAVAALFVVVLLRAGGTYAIGRAAQAGVRRTRLSRAMSLPRFARTQQGYIIWQVRHRRDDQEREPANFRA